MLVSGNVYVNDGGVLDKGSPVALARIVNRTSGEVSTTNSDGYFEIKYSPTDRLCVLSPKASRIYRPRQLTIENIEQATGENPIEIPPEELGLSKLLTIPKFGELPGVTTFSGYLWENFWLLSRWMKVVVVGVVMPFVLAIALDAGLAIPGTDADDSYREFVQRKKWIPTRRALVTFSEVRKVYYSGINYRLRTGLHLVPDGGTVIEDGANLEIEEGCVLKFQGGDGLLVSGKIKAIGSRSEGVIKFVPANSGQRWGNVTIEGNQSIGSVLRYCHIEGGGGFPVIPNSEDRLGGGLLLRNTRVDVENTSIIKCKAWKGGGVYIRNDSPPVGEEELKGSTFNEVAIEGCIAETGNGSGAAGGGGFFVSNTFPEFHDCRFIGNSTKGDNSCGGGGYVGVSARAEFKDSIFEDNSAYAEGGALYMYRARNTIDSHHSGVVIVDNTKINGNSSFGSGGAISGYNSRLYMSDVDIERNSVQMSRFEKTPSSATGGGVFLRFDNKYTYVNDAGQRYPGSCFNNCNFSNNVVKSVAASGANEFSVNRLGGGGLFVMRSPFEFGSNAGKYQVSIKIDGSRFDGNQATNGSQCVLPPSSLAKVSLDIDANFDYGNSDYTYHGLLDWDDLIIQDVGLDFVDYGNYPNRGEESDIKWIVLGAASTQGEETLVYYKTRSSDSEQLPVPHYGIDPEGAIFKLVECSRVCPVLGIEAAARIGYPVDLIDSSAIHVELVNCVNSAPTIQQLKAFATLARTLRHGYGLRRYPIVGRGFLRALVGQQSEQEIASSESLSAEPLINWGQVFQLME